MPLLCPLYTSGAGAPSSPKPSSASLLAAAGVALALLSRDVWTSAATLAELLPDLPPLPQAAAAALALACLVRAASVLRLHGFSVRWSPAVFVEGINASACRGFNGHRMAMRRAWKLIVEANRSMAVFEDDVSPVENSDAASLTSEVHAFILKYQQQHDVLWLGGLARIGACSTANPFGNGCYPTDCF